MVKTNNKKNKVSTKSKVKKSRFGMIRPEVSLSPAFHDRLNQIRIWVQRASNENIEAFWRKIDANNNGMLSLPEYKKMIIQILQIPEQDPRDGSRNFLSMSERGDTFIYIKRHFNQNKSTNDIEKQAFLKFIRDGIKDPGAVSAPLPTAPFASSASRDPYSILPPQVPSQAPPLTRGVAVKSPGQPKENVVLLKLKGVSEQLAKQIEEKIKVASVLLRDGERLTDKESQMLQNSMSIAQEAATDLKKQQKADEENVVSKLNTMQRALDILKTNISRLLERVASETQESRKRIERQERNIGELTKQLQDEQANVRRLTEESRAKEEAIKVEKRESQSKIAQNQEIKRDLESTKEELKTKEKELRKIRKQFTELNERYENTAKELIGMGDSRNRERSESANEIRTLKDSLRAVQQQYITAQSEIAQLKQEKQDLAKEKRILEERINAHLAKISQGDEQLRRTTETIGQKDATIKNLETKIQTLENDKRDRERNIQQAETRLHEISQNNLNMWEALKMITLMSNLGQQGQTIIQTSKNKVISDTESKITKWQSEIDELSKQVAEFTSFGKLRKKRKNLKKILLKNIELHYKAYRELW